MRLEDFTAMVDIPEDADTMHVEQSLTGIASGSIFPSVVSFHSFLFLLLWGGLDN